MNKLRPAYEWPPEWGVIDHRHEQAKRLAAICEEQQRWHEGSE